MCGFTTRRRIRSGFSPETFTKDNIVYQIGVAPVRLDILTHITGVRFADAWPNRMKSTFLGVPIYFISLNDLISNKQAAGRNTDCEHLEYIRKASEYRSRYGRALAKGPERNVIGTALISKCMAIDLARWNIRVNAVAPGCILTSASLREIARLGIGFEQWRDRRAATPQNNVSSKPAATRTTPPRVRPESASTAYSSGPWSACAPARFAHRASAKTNG